MANVPYKIRSSEGVEISGRTDNEGHTGLFTSESVEKIELLLLHEEFEDDTGAD